MQDGTLLLGPVLFQDFEVPACITWGGAHRLVVHTLPGGERIIDALGRDDADLSWCGVFTGEDAAARARVLDTLRAAGGVLPLTWDTFFYSVVISRFAADFTRANWIPYRVCCTVLVDEAAAVLVAALDLATSALADLASAAAYAAPVDLSAATAAVGVPGATTVGTASYGSAMTTLSGDASALDTQVSSGEGALLAASDPGSAADAAGSLAGLAGTRDYVRRALANLTNASS